MTDKKIILASASPRRKELLEQVGIEFETIASDIPEEPLHGETPQEHVKRLSSEKALEVLNRLGDGPCFVIGSDTVVIIDNEILGKPNNDSHAAEMLRKLSGREHKVITGYCIASKSAGVECLKAVETIVRFKPLDENEIAGYVASDEPSDKAGAYAIQGLGSFMVEEIRGSYSNVVGLPVCQIIDDLERLGAVKLFSHS